LLPLERKKTLNMSKRLQICSGLNRRELTRLRHPARLSAKASDAEDSINGPAHFRSGGDFRMGIRWRHGCGMLPVQRRGESRLPARGFRIS
jgi:hypothetical protein